MSTYIYHSYHLDMNWVNDQSMDQLELYKTKSGVSDTIRYDNKWNAQLRARLRHNRSDLNTRLYHMKRIDPPHCPVIFRNNICLS